MNYKKLPNLDKIVIDSLEFFIKNTPPPQKIKKYKSALVVGSGNAYNTARALFHKQMTFISDESNFAQTIKNYRQEIKDGKIKEALIISASGEKDSIWETKLAKKYKLKTSLITCSPQSPAANLADQVLAFKKIPEPYTYNTSTYLGILLAFGTEKARTIKNFIKKVQVPKLKRNFRNYLAYSFILPDEFEAIVSMINIKKDELFGPHLSLRAFTFGEARHAKFVHPWKKELVISFGKNEYFGIKGSRWEIKLPAKTEASLVMALSYFLIGKIQETKPPYFKRHIAKFCQEGKRPYGQKGGFPIIVE